MPKLSAEVTTLTSTNLKVTVKEKLRTLVERLHTRKAEFKMLEKKNKEDKTEIETLFLDAGQEEALKTGVTIETSVGPVPVKIIEDTGKTEDGKNKKGKLNETKLMKKHGLTVKDLDACRDKYKPRASYLGVYLPKEDEDEDE